MKKMRLHIFNVLFIAVFVSMIGLGTLAPIMPFFAQSIGANGLWLGFVFAGFAISRTIFMPLIGVKSDAKGRKNFIIIGLLLYSILSLGYLFVTSVYFLVVIRFFHGFATAMVVPIAMAYVGETTKKGKEGKTIGFFNISLFLGMAIGPLLGGFINDYLGLKFIFLTMFTLSFLAFLIVLFLLPDLKISVKKKKNKPKVSLKSVFKNYILVGLLIFRFINAIGRGGVLSFLPLFAAKIDINVSQIGIIMFINIAITALLQGFFGKIADKYNKFYLIILGSLLAIVSLSLTPLATSFWLLLFISAIMGLGGAIAIPASSAITINIGKTLGMGKAMGLFNMSMSFGMIFAPIISGIIMDKFGIIYIFYNAAIITFLGTILFWFFYKLEMKKQSQI